MDIEYKYGDFENIILNAIWYLEENSKPIVSVSDVVNKINENPEKTWAYTTVKTVMDRLVKKSLVSRLKQGKKYFYKSRYSRLETGAMHIKKLVMQYYNDNEKEFIIHAKALCENSLMKVNV